MTLFLYKTYIKNTIPEILNKIKLKNIYQIPKLEKITINLCNKLLLDEETFFKKSLKKKLHKIINQKPYFSRAKKSISNFSLRKGNLIAFSANLRKFSMYLFLTKFIYLVIPRIRNFKTFKTKMFNKNYNFNFGIKDIFVFPDIKYELNPNKIGLDINFTFTKLTGKNNVSLNQIILNNFLIKV